MTEIKDPTATLLSAGMMLDYLGFAEAARQLEESVKSVYREGKIIPVDQGGRATTTEFCAAIRARL